ncbi:UDP-N-acetylglucosamine 1-carboxyvinyltransferase [Phocea massiliensis]|uniref:UDP-N-acetylglucosamine 1-carboxyvinyltransferase n=1 Tax=Merdimmobilis hominis TaxID=2897707 RepID=A0A938X5T3_9FIRM|nr:UDP-N-acetylglucosamine 1-carboxyvinyltransferase [Merdimmobilis hominis]MBM6920069.1 UDP-N-acetylglucosamine 1-carboxyvinyltransferase [Merdimmobilis hominis]
MEKYMIHGGHRLVGEVEISGAKNAAVAILPATILCDEPCVIENIPNISDVSSIVDILNEMGAKITVINKHTLQIDPTGIKTPEVPYQMARRMRASSYFMGALLGKFHESKVPLPGGCDFGVRPIDQHLKCFTALGATHEVESGVVVLSAEKLEGAHVYFDVVTVGATINAMLCSVLAEGQTIIENAAKEPHIVDLANFLNAMGAEVRGAGTDVIKVRGVTKLHGTVHNIIPDQIEAGTYMVAAAATRGDVLIRGVIPKHLESITSKLQSIGVTVTEFDDAIRVTGDKPYVKTNVKTMPHPGFPTDMQPQIAVLLCLAEGTSLLTEGVWDNRFRYVNELRRLGAEISVDGRVAIIEGPKKFSGAPVKATDLRAGAAMVIAGLVADGVTEIEDIRHIERGYEDIEEKLQMLGADIKKIVVPDSEIAKAL